MAAAAGLRPVHPLGILAERLTRLEAGLASVHGVPEALREELRAARALAAGLDPYVEACTSPPSSALRELAARSAVRDWAALDDGLGLEAEMLSGHVEGAALGFLAAMTGARRVLELGLFSGYSALAMAEALPEDGVLVACELSAAVAEVAREALDGSPAGTRVQIRVGPAADTLGELAADGERFDLVFVDADKAGYAGYVDTLLSTGLLADGGLIAVDNTLMQGLPWGAGEPTANGEAIAAFNRELAADARVEQVLLPLRDGLTLIRRA